MSSSLSYEGTARTIATDAGVLRYHEAGHGPPLVRLQGSGPGVTGWGNFHGNLPVLAEFFRCLILEFPGFGVSDDFGDYPMLAAHDALVQFVEALGLESVDIIGNSMGGGVAIDYASHHPDKVHRLVTIGGIGENMFNPGRADAIELLVEFTQNPTREKLVQWLHSMVHNPASVDEEIIEECWAQATHPDTLVRTRRMYSHAGLAELVNDTDASAWPPWEMLHRVQAPTLLTWGRDDRVSPWSMALIPMRSIPNAELHVFPNCGHWAMIDQKEAFENVVLSFLLRRDPPDYQPGAIGSWPSSLGSAVYH